MRFGSGILILLFVLVDLGCSRESGPPQAAPATQPSAVPAARMSNPAPSEAQTAAGKIPELDSWVKSRIEVSNPSFVSIVEQQPWPHAKTPNTTIVLGIAKRSTEGSHLAEIMDQISFPFVMLLQAKSAENPASRMLAVDYRDDWGTGEGVSLDIRPIQILPDEYAFGVKTVSGSLGNKSGVLVEVLSLYRYRDNRLEEVFRDAVWVYSLYSEKDTQSCNVELEIESQPSGQGGYFTLTRRYRKSYLGSFRTPPPADDTDVPCALTERFRKPNTHRWNPENGKYVGAAGRFMTEDDVDGGRSID
jgi:hypothetical protein